MSIDELLGIDSQNTEASKRGLSQFDTELPEAIDETVSLYETLSRAYSQEARDDDDLYEIEECGRLLGAENQDRLEQLLKADTVPGDPQGELVRRVTLAEDRMRSRRIRGLLLIYVYRCFAFSATDLLRLRVSSAMGYLRLQIEAVAQMSMMFVTPSIAKEWMAVRDDDTGRRFHKKYLGRVLKFAEEHELTFAWNMASGTAQHVRLAGMVSALRQSVHQEGDREATEIRLGFQEADHEKPQDYILRVLTILRTQQRLLRAIREGLPEVTDPILLDARLPRYNQKIDRLWTRLQVVFPESVKKWTANAANVQ